MSAKRRANPDTLTVPEAAERLGISRNAGYEAVKRGELPSIKIGKLILIPRAAFERMLAGEPKAA